MCEKTARLLLMSGSSMYDRKIHPMSLDSVFFCLSHNPVDADMQLSCQTTVVTLKLVLLLDTQHVKLLQKLALMKTILYGIPYTPSIRQRLY